MMMAVRASLVGTLRIKRRRSRRYDDPLVKSVRVLVMMQQRQQPTTDQIAQQCDTGDHRIQRESHRGAINTVFVEADLYTITQNDAASFFENSHWQCFFPSRQNGEPLPPCHGLREKRQIFPPKRYSRYHFDVSSPASWVRDRSGRRPAAPASC